MNIEIKQYQQHLTNGAYITEALDKEMLLHPDYEGSVVLDIDHMGMRLASGYGTWKVELILRFNGLKQQYSITHHNEDWYLCQKMVYDAQIADTEEEQQEAINAFQSAYEAVIDANISEILNRCIEAVETEEEA